MGVKLSVGLQKKVGLPEFGSLGASCHVEFEIVGTDGREREALVGIVGEGA
mgnify:CR=1 FL=1